MLNIRKQALFARWFLLWNICWAKFTDGKGVLKDDARTNLCTFFWVSVGAPVFIVGAHILALAFAFYVLVLFGVSHLTALGLLIEVAAITVPIGAIYFIIILIGWLGRFLSKLPAKPEKPPREKRPSLTIAYLRAVHDRTCPLIQLEDSK